VLARLDGAKHAERDYMNEHADVKGAVQQRDTATRNARVIEEFLSANRLADRE
jgi:hypothetical protein